MEILRILKAVAGADWVGFAGTIVVTLLMVAFLVRAHNNTHQCINCGRASVPRKKRRDRKIVRYCRYCGQIVTKTLLFKKTSWKNV